MIIQAIQPSKHIRGRYLVQLSDESLLKVTEQEVVTFGLYTGKELDPDTLSALKQAFGQSNARALAARMISCRPLSRKELLQRLSDKGVEEADALQAADWLQDIGILDEGAYAASVVRHYSGQGYGQKKLESELYRRGIPRKFWQEALQQAAPAEDGIVSFLEARFRTRDPNDPKELRRATDALLRRGYSWGQIRTCLSDFTDSLLPEE